MPTAEEDLLYYALRNNTGDTIMTLPDDEAALLFAQAATQYSASAAWAGVRVLRILELMGGAYKQVSYVQNQESESLTDIFNNLLKLLGEWKRLAADADPIDTVGTATPPPSGTVRLRPVW